MPTITSIKERGEYLGMESRERLAARISSGVAEEFVREEMRRVKGDREAEAGCQVARVLKMQTTISPLQPDQNLPPQQTPKPEQ